MTVFIGIDLAWSTKASTGVAAVDASGRLMRSATLRTDSEIDDWLALNAPGEIDVVAVDAPLIVTNPTGQRACERLVTAAYGRFDAGCHASNTGQAYMNPPRAAELARRQGWATDPESPGPGLCIEVYPHPAMVSLFQLGRILPYKAKPRRSLATRQTAMAQLRLHLEGIATLRLKTNKRWQEIAGAVHSATRPVDLGRVEDEIDAILCAHLAWLWRQQPKALHVYGTTDAGYIIAPPPPSHSSTPRPRPTTTVQQKASRPDDTVAFHVAGQPATFATAGERAWRDTVSAAAGEAMGGRTPLTGRLRVSIDFITATRPAAHPGWDLDNLIKPTIDALLPILGTRLGRWRRSQADDERVDEIVARKRAVRTGEETGAIISVTRLPLEP